MATGAQHSLVIAANEDVYAFSLKDAAQLGPADATATAAAADVSCGVVPWLNLAAPCFNLSDLAPAAAPAVTIAAGMPRQETNPDPDLNANPHLHPHPHPHLNLTLT